MTVIVQQAVVVPEGAGVEVKRLMPVAGMRNFDPFVLWDHFDISSGGFPNHPHRGFEAITYMFAGGMQHTDNLGNKGTVHGGGAQRFTAGRGIVHSEMPDGHAAGIQLWINLPRKLKGLDPEYQQVQADEFGVEEFGGGSLKKITGENGPVQLRTDVEYFDVSLDEGASFHRDIAEGLRGLVYAVSGSLSINDQTVDEGAAAFVEGEGSLSITATRDSRFMWCFGRPHGEPIYQHGPFVD